MLTCVRIQSCSPHLDAATTSSSSVAISISSSSSPYLWMPVESASVCPRGGRHDQVVAGGVAPLEQPLPDHEDEGGDGRAQDDGHHHGHQHHGPAVAAADASADAADAARAASQVAAVSAQVVPARQETSCHRYPTNIACVNLVMGCSKVILCVTCKKL